MPENRYRLLFELQLLHHYWLDEGNNQFDSLSKEEQEKRLRSYDCRRFFVIAPTAGTAKILDGLSCMYKTTALGFFAALPDKVAVPAETMFEFAVTVRDPDFFNYTALTIRPQKIYEFYHKQEKKTYRYKENIPVLSNQSGSVRENISSNGNTLFLSQEFPASTDGVESFFIENDQLKQMTNDKSGDLQDLGIKDDNPVYIHQGDAPVIILPDGITGAPERGLLLSLGIQDDIFTLIRLQARPDNEQFSLVNANGQAKNDHPVFHVRFKNRSTFWKYLNKKTGKESPIVSAPLPLTYFGNVGTKQKPSKGQFVKIEKDEDNKITRLVSEIFI